MFDNASVDGIYSATLWHWPTQGDEPTKQIVNILAWDDGNELELAVGTIGKETTA